MKCQKCDKPATFHITEMINGDHKELHLCDDHAYQYLHQNDIPQEIIDEDKIEEEYSLKELTEKLECADFDCCPCCEQTLLDFRKTGRLGCANDYSVFRERLEPLMMSVHGDTKHRGKQPVRMTSVDDGVQLVRLRNDLHDAIQTEDYERASVLRDKINALTGKVGA